MSRRKIYNKLDQNPEYRPYSEEDVMKTLIGNNDAYAFNTCYIIETPEDQLKPGEFEYKLGFLSASESDEDSEKCSLSTSRCSTPGQVYDRTFSSNESLLPKQEHLKSSYFPQKSYPVKAKSTTSLILEPPAFQEPFSSNYYSSVPSLENSSIPSDVHYNRNFALDHHFVPFLSQQNKNSGKLNLNRSLNIDNDLRNNSKYPDSDVKPFPKCSYGGQWQNNRNTFQQIPNPSINVGIQNSSVLSSGKKNFDKPFRRYSNLHNEDDYKSDGEAFVKDMKKTFNKYPKSYDEDGYKSEGELYYKEKSFNRYNKSYDDDGYKSDGETLHRKKKFYRKFMHKQTNSQQQERKFHFNSPAKEGVHRFSSYQNQSRFQSQNVPNMWKTNPTNNFFSSNQSGNEDQSDSRGFLWRNEDQNAFQASSTNQWRNENQNAFRASSTNQWRHENQNAFQAFSSNQWRNESQDTSRAYPFNKWNHETQGDSRTFCFNNMGNVAQNPPQVFSFGQRENNDQSISQPFPSNRWKNNYSQEKPKFRRRRFYK